jgi:hypothetical protein
VGCKKLFLPQWRFVPTRNLNMYAHNFICIAWPCWPHCLLNIGQQARVIASQPSVFYLILVGSPSIRVIIIIINKIKDHNIFMPQHYYHRYAQPYLFSAEYQLTALRVTYQLTSRFRFCVSASRQAYFLTHPPPHLLP